MKLWVKGLLIHHPGRLLGAMVGVGLTVALLASIGAFISSSSETMTQRALKDVPVDWQVQLATGADASKVRNSINNMISYSALEEIGFADSAGFRVSTGNTVQTTGPGQVVGIDSTYRKQFPDEMRNLIGADNGVLVAQQTAANLHVKTGDTVTITRIGLPSVDVKVDGIIDFPNADSLFQVVGLSAGSPPQAPPDNVLLLPNDQWHKLFDEQAAAQPKSVHTQFHIRIEHTLPNSPSKAYTYVTQLAHHVEASLAGNGVIGNNLAARLDGVRKDALYSEVLFLFLGLPGAMLAAFLTVAVTAAGTKRRRQEQALLRTRGASISQILSLAGIESIIVAVGGVILGVLLFVSTAKYLGIIASGAHSFTVLWTIFAASVGVLLALFAVLYPAWTEARTSSVSSARAVIRQSKKPIWQWIYLDFMLIIAAMAVYFSTSNLDYQLVLATEGVAKTSVHYETFIAPFCLWLGACLLAIRLLGSALRRCSKVIVALCKPFVGSISNVVVSSLVRQRNLITRGAVLVALACSFATSTAVFNSTYNMQSRIDAQLTNGSDVTVTGSTEFPPTSRLAQLSSLPGVAAAQTMQHRFAFVGNDLQDIYGIDPLHIGDATQISNAFFAGGHSQAVLTDLAKSADAVLVSAETAKDYQLRVGDLINLRLQNVQDHQYHVIPFHFIGIVNKFPSAPKDSFLIVNKSYLTAQTGSNAEEIVLMRTNSNPASVANQARSVVSSLPGIKVSDIRSTQNKISSSLTSVDLKGLTQLELTYAVFLVAGATGLILALGLTERRRMYSILTALGANNKQLGAFIWTEGILILIFGSVIGTLLGFGIAQMLVKILNGVFDPQPETLFIPWNYLAGLMGAAILSTAIAVLNVQKASRQSQIESLRNL